MGVLGEILEQKWRDHREQKLVDKATARFALTGTDPTKDEIKAFLKGKISAESEDPRYQELARVAGERSADTSALRKMFAMKRAGLLPDDFENYQSRPDREALFDRLNDSQKADFLNKKTLAPVGVSGGQIFNRYDTKDPQLGTTDQSLASAAYDKARAAKVNAEKNDIQMRSDEIRKFLEKDDTLASIDAANKKSVLGEPKKVVVKGKDGKDETVFVERNPDGSMRVISPKERLFRPKSQSHRLEKSDSSIWNDSLKASIGELNKNRFTNDLVPPEDIRARALEHYRLTKQDPSAMPPIDSDEQEVGKENEYPIGREVEHNGVTYKVVGYDSDGEPLMEPVY